MSREQGPTYTFVESPMLIGIETLMRLGAVIDFERDLAIFRNISENDVVGLQRSETGLLLMDCSEELLSRVERDPREAETVVKPANHLEAAADHQENRGSAPGTKGNKTSDTACYTADDTAIARLDSDRPESPREHPFPREKERHPSPVSAQGMGSVATGKLATGDVWPPKTVRKQQCDGDEPPDEGRRDGAPAGAWRRDTSIVDERRDQRG